MTSTPHTRYAADRPPRDYSQHTDEQRRRAKRRAHVVKAILDDPHMFPMLTPLSELHTMDKRAITAIRIGLIEIIPGMRKVRKDTDHEHPTIAAHRLTGAETRAIKARHYRSPGPGDTLDAYCRVTRWRDDRPSNGAGQLALADLAETTPEPPRDAPEPVAPPVAPPDKPEPVSGRLCASWDEVGALLDTLDSMAAPISVEVVITGAVSLRFDIASPTP